MSIDERELRSWQPTRSSVAKRLVGETNDALNRRELVALGQPGYLPGVNSDWDSREYRRRWQHAGYYNTSGEREVEVAGQCSGDFSVSTLDVVCDLAGIYKDRVSNGGHRLEGEAYSEVREKSVLGGANINAYVYQHYDGGSGYDSVGSAGDQYPVVYVLPERSGSSHMLSVQDCVLQYDNQSFCYREGLTMPWHGDVGVGDRHVVRVSLNASFDPSRPFKLRVYFSPYYGAELGGVPRFAEDAEPDDIPSIPGEQEGDEPTPDREFQYLHLIGLSAWAY